MSEFSIIFEIGAILVSLFVLFLLFKILKSLLMLLINSIGALLLLFLINAIFGLNIVINVFSILAVAIGGFPGLILVILLKFFNLAF